MLDTQEKDYVLDLLKERKGFLIELLKSLDVNADEGLTAAIELSDVNSTIRKIEQMEDDVQEVPRWFAEMY